MRVTKVIREYVEREVSAKFDAKIYAIGTDYAEECNELKRRLTELEKETEVKAHEIAKELGFDYGGGYRGAVSISTYSFKNKEKEDANNDSREKLREQKKAAIENILLDLELGETTKSELKGIIDSVEV